MNFAIIFAGGTGTRMKSDTPKQFMLINKKPILVHTIEKFQNSKIIDKIVVVCLKNYISTVYDYISLYNLTKVVDVISGGKTAFESQQLGIKKVNELSFGKEDIVFIHDGVRPLINEDLIKVCYDEVLKNGSAITASPASETIAVLNESSKISNTIPRQNCVLARAPQVFYLKDIAEAHRIAKDKNMEYIDSASMFLDQGKKLNIIVGPVENIKITTQFDFALCTLLLGGEKNE